MKFLLFLSLLLSAVLSTAQVTSHVLNATTSGEVFTFEPYNASSTNEIHVETYASLNGELYVVGATATTGNELYKFDPSTGTVSLVIDLNPGADGSLPLGLQAFNGNLYFHADDGNNGREMYRSDGTAAGTRIIDINPGAADAFDDPIRRTSIFEEIGNTLYLSAKTPGAFRAHLLSYNVETEALISYPDLDWPEQVMELNGVVYANAAFNDFHQLNADGTETRITTEAPRGLYTAVGNRFLASGKGSVNFYDPVTNTVDSVYNTSRVTGGTSRVILEKGGLTYFFSYHTDLGSQELWSTDGTAAGTTCLDIVPGSDGATGYAWSIWKDQLVGYETFAPDGFYAIDLNANSIGMISNVGPRSGSAVNLFNDAFVFTVSNPNGELKELTDLSGTTTTFNAPLGNTYTANYLRSDKDFLIASFLGDNNFEQVVFSLDCSLNNTVIIDVCEDEDFIINNVVYNRPGTYFDEIEVLRGCDSFQQINVFPLPTISVTGPDTILMGNVASFTNATGPAQWPDGSIATTFQLQTSGLSLGYYNFAIQLTDPVTGCFSQEELTVYIAGSSSTSSAFRQNLKLVPNPAQSSVEIFNGQPTDLISVFDDLGRLTQRAVGTSVNVQNLPSGLYTISVQREQAVEWLRLVKQ